MMYTFQPLPIVDTLNSHVGFYTLAVILAAALLLIWVTGEDFRPEALLVIYAILISGPAYISWNSGKITIPENEQVIATLYDQWGEAHEEQRRSGKVTQTVIIHSQYVTYQVPDGRIVNFPMSVGIPYPIRAILYKN